MLSTNIVRKIESQIESELRTVDSLGSDDDEKMAALDRIAKLKAILSPDTVLVIKETEEVDEDETLTSSLADLVRSFRKR